ncbi:MAG: hypothetical protein H0W11_01805 [Gemmatimonadetes bacterium]|nr:hypothetical protein [Gemmatimonadota bacterium]
MIKFRPLRLRLILLVLPLLASCGLGGDRDLQLPTNEEAASRYGAGVAVELRGNLLEVRAPMTAEQLERGGTLWARGGPYFYLFSTATRDLFVEYADLAAVRVVTETAAGEEVARAELHRDAIAEPRWRQALGLSALAQQEGTQRPRRVEELIYFGEDYTQFEYNPEFAGQ